MSRLTLRSPSIWLTALAALVVGGVYLAWTGELDRGVLARDDRRAGSGVFADTALNPLTVTPFFADDFESGDFAKGNDRFRWSEPNKTKVDNAVAHSGAYSLRFRYPGSDLGADAMAEQRFELEGEPRELWVEWWVYLPPNWTLRDDSGPSNNKLFAVWNEVYSGDNVMVVAEYHRADESTAYTAVVSRNHMRSPSLVAAPVFTAAQRGQWTRLRMHLRSATSETSLDGLFETLRDSTLTTRYLGELWSPNGKTWKQGYFLGWANTGFTEETHIFVDDVKFYDRDPAWPGTVAAGAVRPVVSAPTTYATADGIDHTFSHTRNAANEDVFLAVYGIGMSRASRLDLRYAGIEAERVAGRGMTGKANMLAWYRVPAAVLGATTGAHPVTLSFTGTKRGVHLQAFNVSDVGAITEVGGGEAEASSAFRLPSLDASPQDVVLSAFVSQGDAQLAASDMPSTGLSSLSVSDEGSPSRGRPERRMLTRVEPADAARVLSIAVSEPGVPVAGLALRIKGARIHP